MIIAKGGAWGEPAPGVTPRSFASPFGAMSSQPASTKFWRSEGERMVLAIDELCPW